MIEQTIPSLTQTLTASFTPGASTGAAYNALPSLLQSVSSTFSAGPVFPVVHSTSGELVYECPSTPELIWG